MNAPIKTYEEAVEYVAEMRAEYLRQKDFAKEYRNTSSYEMLSRHETMSWRDYQAAAIALGWMFGQSRIEIEFAAIAYADSKSFRVGPAASC